MNAPNRRDCRQFEPFGISKAPTATGIGCLASRLSSLLESGSVYKIPNMPTVAGMSLLGARSLGCGKFWYLHVSKNPPETLHRTDSPYIYT